MNNIQNTSLTSSQLTMFPICIFLGVGLLYSPNIAIKDVGQCGWISCIVGALYPIIISTIANHVYKRYPDDDIMALSTRFLGKIMGNICNIIFVTFFIFIESAELTAMSNVFKVYTTTFLKDYQIFFTTMTVVVYVAYKGMKPLARLNEVLFYMTTVLVLIPVVALKYGSILNIMPVFDCGIKNLLKSGWDMSFLYTGAESLFLIYPFYKEKDKFMKCNLLAIGFTTFVYVLITFCTIFYLGIDISPKYLWPVLTLSDSVDIPVITSFRYIFMSLWALTIFRCLSIYHFFSSYGLSRILPKVSSQKFSIILYPVIIILSSLYGTTTMRRHYTDKIMPYYVIFNFIYIIVVTILLHLKKGDNVEKA